MLYAPGLSESEARIEAARVWVWTDGNKKRNDGETCDWMEDEIDETDCDRSRSGSRGGIVVA